MKEMEKTEITKEAEKKKMPMAIKIAIGFLCVILLGGVGAFAYVQHYLGKINKATPMSVEEIIPPSEETFEVDENALADNTGADENVGPESNENVDVTIPMEELNPEDIKLHVASDVMDNKDVVNILLIGQDRREGEGRARSDAMILVTMNKKTEEIHMTSFMRDLYVELPGNYSANRLNAAYQFGGMELLDATLERNFGIKVDGNIEVDFNSFEKCIDKVGGVDIELNEVEVNYLNKRYPWKVQVGMNHLTGEKALAYSRIRYVGNADYERTERQRRVLMDVFNKLKKADLRTITGFADEMFPLLTTDMSKMDILGYAVEGFSIGMDNMGTGRVPTNGAFKPAVVRGMQVLVPDLEKNRNYLQTELYGN